ncbi:MAG: glycosyltransferase family 39 protein [Oligoflexia bacterium]|nr:glycosyltransferase family 39 protein [Oligoflexia bacterium]
MIRNRLKLPLALFFVLWIHGVLIGLTDDEAYYWALAQRPAWAYAYHPPMVAWLIAVSQHVLGWLLGTHSSAMVRFPSAALISASFALVLRWFEKAGVSEERLTGAGTVVLSLAGIFALSWMMVPDLPLIFGWMLAFSGCWGFITEENPSASDYLLLALGVVFAILSKYSGVLVAGSAGLSILLWARGSSAKVRGCAVIFLSAALASLPLLIWNAHHQWASILYQIRDRHAGSALSFSRYLRFWVIEAVAAGPALLFFSFASFSKLFRKRELVFSYLWVWALPALLIYCVQPLWSDFKPHWALIGWWPLMLALGWSYGRGKWQRLARLQRGYGLALGVFVVLACHIPVGNWALASFQGKGQDPRLDVTNDLTAWNLLEPYLRSLPGNSDLRVPVVGSRYQTAGQAFFALGPESSVTLIPREIKERDEWPDLGILADESSGRGVLKKSIFFVTDIRYDAPPEFADASCVKIQRLEALRGGILAKWVEVWRCDPRR